MDLTTLHRRTVEWWEARVDDVGPDAWGNSTPCEAWTVRDLVNHVVGEELWTVPLLEGATIAEVGDRFDGDVLGENPTATCHAAASAAVRSVDEVTPRGVKVHLSYGDEAAEEYVRQLAADHLVHGWDLAVATGSDARLDPELVDAVAGWFAEREELYRGSGAIAAHVDRHGDPQTELLAAFGRDARWAATP
ncbi:MAG: TIGR03086 family metal-binding protein [Nocardioides sp.]